MSLSSGVTLSFFRRSRALLTVLNEFYRVAFRKKVYRSLDELQADLDVWVREYNELVKRSGFGVRRC